MYTKRVLALLLVICTLACLPHAAEKVFATSATEKKEQAESELGNVNSEIDNIKDSQQQVTDKIEKTRIELANLFKAQEALEEEIADNEAAIVKTEKELKKAEEDEKEQYEAMKLRIQYMYENSAKESLLDAVIGAENFADLLKRVEYVTAVHKADRELTEQYKQVVQTVKEKKQMLIEQGDMLLAKQEAYLGQQMQIEEKLAMLEGEEDSYANLLASAQKKASEYQKMIEEQNAIILREEEERRRQEEEKKKQEGENNGNSTGTVTPTVPINPKGQAIVDYALQFVGCPYVYGGKTDIKKGVDCSGFVNLVYKHFGYSVPSYSMNFYYMGINRPGVIVPLEEIQPGDIVIYAQNSEGIGHVAIYIGNGKIVEAQSTKAGVTCNRDLQTGRQILGVRRMVD